jgi:hypothetical protein
MSIDKDKILKEKEEEVTIRLLFIYKIEKTYRYF